MKLSTIIYTPENMVFQYFLTILGQMVHSDLVRQIEYIKVENEILRSKLPKQIRTTYQEKLKLIRYGLRVGGKIKNLIAIVNYSTYRRWINALEEGSLKRNVKIGKPRKTTKEIIELIVRMAKDNADWGYGRIMGELKKLGIKLGRNTIKHYMIENDLNPAPKRYEDSWDAYIKRTFETLFACDFFSKTICTPLGIKTIFVLFFINIRTRKVHIAGTSYKPTAQWVIEKTKEIESLFDDDTTKLLIRDADGKYPDTFDDIFKKYNTKVKKLPYRSPNLNPYAEGFVGTIKRECLDKFFVFGKEHFDYLVKNFVDFYNTNRPHSGLDNETIGSLSKGKSEVKCESRLGGVVKHYYRE